jgi:hypothetical protein
LYGAFPEQLVEACNSTGIAPCKEARLDYEYIRHGIANIFMANEPKGKRMVEVKEQKTKKDWASLIKRVSDAMYLTAKKIPLVMDNFKIHSIGAFYGTYMC